MTPTVRRALLGAPLAAVLLVAAGCGGSDSPAPADTTLPATLSVPGTSSSTVPSASTTTTGVPPTNPAGTGAPVIVSVTAEPGADTCTDGTIPAVVRFEVEPEPPVRVFTIFLDGAQTPAASSNTGPSLTIPVPCDGAVHQVLFIATGTGADPQSSTQAVAFRAPRPA